MACVGSKVPVLVVDTTEFFSDLKLKRSPWEQTLLRSSRGHWQLWIPQVAVQEAARHHRKEAESHLAAAEKALKGLQRTGSIGSSQLPEIHDLLEPYRAVLGGYEAWLVERLKAAGARILPLPKVPHSDLLERALAERRPFRIKDDGKGKRGPDGYRDALIWASVVEAAGDLGGHDTLVFVTNNSGDFCGTNPAELHDDLLADLPITPQTIRYPSLEDALKSIPEPKFVAPVDLAAGPADDMDGQPPLGEVMREAVAGACDGLAGEDLGLADDDEARGGLILSNLRLPTGVDHVTIDEALPDLLTTDWSIYDRYEDGLVLAEVTVEADVSFEAFMYKSDYYAHDPAERISLLDGDWNDHMVRVGLSRNVQLTFHATIDPETNDVELTFEGGQGIDSETVGTRTGS
ncbi:hypothetical protein Kpho02_76430 [Kitasatospora phosalacinea]|uniref:DUF4935 domain-containing protein n=1 Tax=Kitasatospora phosalacinea TaxID=2065 RepID=A0A9W6V534_9ACTN|nr:hypothetical protein Kpho02_76430 [Kitasatospora phosalacinea]